MHIHFEKTGHVYSDSWILSLSWMGKVPEELPEEEGWKLNRTNYYQEGWLATGNMRGILGVTFTTTQWKDGPQPPARTNFNLRGHRSQITLVQWNEPYQKLASCDSSGIIFVWIKFEGRWSIELINDRSTPVTHFSWSHDGRMALICYQDGFVLVGSVAGQRYWSSMLNLDSTITAGTWTPDDQQVYFGTSNGHLVVMDVQGMMVSQIQLPVDSPVTHLTWNCEKFKMEESEEGELWSGARRPLVLAVAFKNGLIYMMRSFDDLAPAHIYTGMQGLFIEWSNSGEYLAVAGSRPVEVMTQAGVRHHEYFNSLHFYSPNAIRISNLTIPSTESPVTSLCFGHNDKRIFIATGKELHIGWVSKRIATLQLLCRLMIYKSLSTETCVGHLPLPLPVRALISSLHTQTIISNLPSTHELRHFSIHPQPNNQRLYCTMVRHQEDLTQTPGTVYTLYIENLGGVVPILKGKRISKIRPEFIIYDPEVTEISSSTSPQPEDGFSSTSVSSRPSTPRKLGPRTCRGKASRTRTGSGSSDSDELELCASPRMSRKRQRNRLRERAREEEREREEDWERNRNGLLPRPEHQLNYNDTLPESLKIAEISSNIWGTKFKIRGLVPFLPENLGQVTYRTSVLHLQPRQMTIRLTELRDENDIFFFPTDPLFLQDDYDEEDLVVMEGSSDNFSYAHPADYFTPPMPTRCLLQPHAQLSLETAHVEAVDPSSSSSFPCQVCETSLASSSQSSCDTLRHNSLQRLKGNNGGPFITARAHIERIEERSAPINSPPSSYSLNRRAGSIRSPTRRCWTGATEESTQVAPPVVTAPIHVRRSMSASYLDSVYQLPLPLDIVGEEGQGGSPPRRLILVKGRQERKKCLGETGKSKSWDSYDLNWWKKGGIGRDSCRGEMLRLCPKCTFPTVNSNVSSSPLHTSLRRRIQKTIEVEDRIERERLSEARESPRNSQPRIPDPPPAPTHRRSVSLLTPLLRRREKSRPRSEEESGDLWPSKTTSKSAGPSSGGKVKQSYLSTASSPLRQLFANSPLLSRRKSRQKETYVESSEDEESDGGHRLVRPHSSPSTSTRISSPSRNSRNRADLPVNKENFLSHYQGRMLGKKKIHDIEGSRVVRRRREFVMSNKAPMWNENSQVYQLDFGGRVTQESAKNFQIEFRGKQVMQFGRIDGNAYTLDFQYPFSPLQAFAVALANVTQRLK